MKFRNLLITGSLIVTVASGSAIASSDTFFPPSNSRECSTNTALMWAGPGHDTYCRPVIPADAALGDPLFARVVRLQNDDMIVTTMASGVRQIFGGDTSTAEYTMSKCLPAAWQTTAGLSTITSIDACLFAICQGATGIYPTLVANRGACAIGEPSGNCRRGNSTDALTATLEVSCIYQVSVPR